MSHPTQFRVYSPKNGKCYYSTGFAQGKPLMLLSLDKTERFREVYSPEVTGAIGDPIIQLATGERDVNKRMIYEGDVVFFHRFNWLGVVVKKENLIDKTSDDSINFWLQMKDGICSLSGSHIIGEVLFETGLHEYEKIQQVLLSSKDILLKYNLLNK